MEMKQQIYYAALREICYAKFQYPMCCKGSKNVRHLRAEIRNHCKEFIDCYYYIWTTDYYGEVIVEKYRYICGKFIDTKDIYKKYDSTRTNRQPSANG